MGCRMPIERNVSSETASTQLYSVRISKRGREHYPRERKTGAPKNVSRRAGRRLNTLDTTSGVPGGGEGG